MTALARSAMVIRLPLWLLRVCLNLILGTLLCLSPLTALLVLGWLTRRMKARVDAHRGRPAIYPGWVLGPRGKGWIVRLLGGLAANIRAGVMTATGLAALTLPFSMLWLGAWWAGWENSFNKGYEQSAVGPVTWLIGALIALPILAHLPMALVHAATEQRLGAFFEFRRIRSVTRAAGWRVPWLALMSVVVSVPFFGLRALPVFVEGIVPGFSEMPAAEQMQVAQIFGLAGAALCFAVLVFLRDRASGIYARAAGSGGRTPSRAITALWLVISCAIWAGLPLLLLFGQFMNYTPVLWLTHPVFLLPWAG